MNDDNRSANVRFEHPGATRLIGQPQRDEFSHLHFDRTTRTWWGHPDSVVQLPTAVPVRTYVAAMGCP